MALSTGAPGWADPPTWPTTLAIRTASGRKTASSVASSPVTPTPLLRWSALSACCGVRSERVVAGVDADVGVGVVAELVQVAVELADVAGPLSPRAERGRRGSRRTAAPPACRRPGRGRRRNRPCRRLRAAGCRHPPAWLMTAYGEPSEPRPVGQGSGPGDQRRELSQLHLLGVRRRRLGARGRAIRSRQHDDGADPPRPARPRRPAPTSSASPLASRRQFQDAAALVRRGIENRHPAGLVGGRDFGRVDQRLTVGGVRKVLHAVFANTLGEPQARRLLLGRSASRSARPAAPGPCRR